MFKRILIVLLFFGLVSPAFAANPPPAQEAGPQAERFKAGVEEERKRLEEKKPKPPEIEIEEKEKKPAAEGPSFILKEVNITGATVFSAEDFKPTYQSYLGTKTTFNDLNLIAEKIKKKYKEKGYLTTTAYVPEQEIRDGKVKIRVIEGKTGTLKIEGNKWFSPSFIEKFFHEKKMSFWTSSNCKEIF